MSTETETVVQTLPAVRKRVGFADPEYAGIMDFLNEESDLLDRDQYVAWVELLAEDVSYTIPRRKTVHKRDGTGVDESSAFPANLEGLKDLAARNVREEVYDRDPPPRMRRFVTNVKAYRTAVDNEFEVDSYLLFLRTKQNEPTYNLVSAERKDVLRLTDDGFKLARRRVIFDLTILSTPLPNVIL